MTVVPAGVPQGSRHRRERQATARLQPCCGQRATPIARGPAAHPLSWLQISSTETAATRQAAGHLPSEAAACLQPCCGPQATALPRGPQRRRSAAGVQPHAWLDRPAQAPPYTHRPRWRCPAAASPACQHISQRDLCKHIAGRPAWRMQPHAWPERPGSAPPCTRTLHSRCPAAALPADKQLCVCRHMTVFLDAVEAGIFRAILFISSC